MIVGHISDISELPLGTLVKAHKAVKSIGHNMDDESESSGSGQESERKAKQDRGPSTLTRKKRQSIEHRSSKHACVRPLLISICILILRRPMEVTSKKPVPRGRQVVEIHRTVSAKTCHILTSIMIPCVTAASGSAFL